MPEEKKSLVFREKSIQRVSSPEELNDYNRVTTPSVWIGLAALVVLLAGMLAWSVFGTVERHGEDGSVEAVHPITYLTNGSAAGQGNGAGRS